MARLPEVQAGVEDADYSETTVLVTGGTSGIGRQVALAFGRVGADVILHGRNSKRGEAMVERLHDTDASGVELFLADFQTQENVHALANYIIDQRFEVDVLVNNAGAYFSDPQLSADGIERTMAVNHCAPFILTRRLESVLDGGRVVTTTSDFHHKGSLLDDNGALNTAIFTGLDDFRSWNTYCQSKLANVLFTRELARRTDLTATCYHPGFVPRTKLFREVFLPWRVAIRFVGFIPIAGTILGTAAAPPLFLGLAPGIENHSGEYFDGFDPAEPSEEARDDDLARALWEESLRLTGGE